MMNKRQWWVMMVSVLAAGFLGGMVSNLLLAGFPVSAKSGAGAATAVTAREFRLVDAQGALRARLALDKDSSFLSFYDASGKAQATMSLNATGPDVSLVGNDGKSGAVMLVADGSPGIMLTDANGISRLGCVVSDKISGFTIQDSNDKTRAVLSVNDDIGPRIRFNDAEEQPIAYLGVDKTGHPGLSIQDKGLERIWLGMWNNGSGLDMWDTNNKRRISLFLGETPSLEFDDASENKVWGAP